jgi:hypothetical protein
MVGATEGFIGLVRGVVMVISVMGVSPAGMDIWASVVVPGSISNERGASSLQ